MIVGLLVPPSPFMLRRAALSGWSVKTAGPHKYGCLLLPLPTDLAKEITDWTLEHVADVHVGKGGRENRPHVTLKYGFTEADGDVTERLVVLLARCGPIPVRLIGVSLFPPGDDGAVLKVDVESPELHSLNAAVSAGFDCVDKFPDYRPHITLSYIDPEAAELYAEEVPSFVGRTVLLDVAEYVTAEGEVTKLPLSFLPVFGSKADPTPPKIGESYFASCERDDGGHCLPSGEQGDRKPDDAASSVVPPVIKTRLSRLENRGLTCNYREPNKDIPDESRRYLNDPQQAAAVELYQMSHYHDINTHLWDGSRKLQPEHEWTLSKLQKTMAETKPFDEPVVVHRGPSLTGKQRSELISHLKSVGVGGEYEHKGFLSTSTGGIAKGEESSYDRPLQFVIRARKGLDVTPVADAEHAHEREMLLPPGRFKITKIEEQGGKTFVHFDQVIDNAGMSDSTDANITKSLPHAVKKFTKVTDKAGRTRCFQDGTPTACQSGEQPALEQHQQAPADDAPEQSTPAEEESQKADPQFEKEWAAAVESQLDEIESSNVADHDYSAQEVAAEQDWHTQLVTGRSANREAPLKPEDVGTVARFTSGLLNKKVGGESHVAALTKQAGAGKTENRITEPLHDALNRMSPETQGVNAVVAALIGWLFGEQALPIVEAMEPQAEGEQAPTEPENRTPDQEEESDTDAPRKTELAGVEMSPEDELAKAPQQIQERAEADPTFREQWLDVRRRRGVAKNRAVKKQQRLDQMTPDERKERADAAKAKLDARKGRQEGRSQQFWERQERKKEKEAVEKPAKKKRKKKGEKAMSFLNETSGGALLGVKPSPFANRKFLGVHAVKDMQQKKDKRGHRYCIETGKGRVPCPQLNKPGDIAERRAAARKLPPKKKPTAPTPKDVAKRAAGALAENDKAAVDKIADEIKRESAKTRGGLGVVGLKDIAAKLGMKGGLSNLKKAGLTAAIVEHLVTAKKLAPVNNLQTRLDRIKLAEKHTGQSFTDRVLSGVMGFINANDERYLEAVADASFDPDDPNRLPKASTLSYLKAMRKNALSAIRDGNVPVPQLKAVLSSLAENGYGRLSPDEFDSYLHGELTPEKAKAKVEAENQGIIPDGLKLVPVRKRKGKQPDKPPEDYTDRLRTPYGQRLAKISELEKAAGQPFLSRVMQGVTGHQDFRMNGQAEYEAALSRIVNEGGGTAGDNAIVERFAERVLEAIQHDEIDQRITGGVLESLDTEERAGTLSASELVKLSRKLKASDRGRFIDPKKLAS